MSPDGEEGYPGTVTLTVTYTLTKNNALRVAYTGATDKPTLLNPTQPHLPTSGAIRRQHDPGHESS